MSVDIDPAEVGVDAGRLRRIDTHLQRYVDDGRLAGWQVRVSRRGRTVHASVAGQRDREAGLPVQDDTLWRIYSMTKPVTAIAALALYERGLFRLNDELARYLPEFGAPRVLVGGNLDAPRTAPASQPIRLWHLFTHTAGLTYAFTRASVLDELYRMAGADPIAAPEVDLAGMCQRWAQLPLMFEPGSAWNYSVATDVLGRVIEVLTGTALDQALQDLVLRPAGMTETRWWVQEPDTSRLAALYRVDPASGQAVRHDTLGQLTTRPPVLLSGGGGLVSTADDYARFTALLVHGGELDGQRVLSPRTLAFAGRNHLPGGALLTAIARGPFAEVSYEGIGFGLGMGVMVDPAAAKVTSSPGELTWGGLASTAFWVDPAAQLTVEFYTQLVPSSTHPLRTELRQLVYAALLD